ncbi:unnamed protein product [Notodromas monacha]|uniref:CCHC-type domain-containing protein n=1 Tax=Notodromas monacha TaxID=399045 RepID=A0A7R9BL93_9CRUS|nr:unnamed protein product [Notodromas monacha]CAG0917560.1 unnamed protein product [Notodromas monacha]
MRTKKPGVSEAIRSPMLVPGRTGKGKKARSSSNRKLPQNEENVWGSHLSRAEEAKRLSLDQAVSSAKENQLKAPLFRMNAAAKSEFIPNSLKKFISSKSQPLSVTATLTTREVSKAEDGMEPSANNFDADSVIPGVKLRIAVPSNTRERNLLKTFSPIKNLDPIKCDRLDTQFLSDIANNDVEFAHRHNAWTEDSDDAADASECSDEEDYESDCETIQNSSDCLRTDEVNTADGDIIPDFVLSTLQDSDSDETSSDMDDDVDSETSLSERDVGFVCAPRKSETRRKKRPRPTVDVPETSGTKFAKISKDNNFVRLNLRNKCATRGVSARSKTKMKKHKIEKRFFRRIASLGANSEQTSSCSSSNATGSSEAKDSPMTAENEPPKRRGRCFTCGKTGHWAYECPVKTTIEPIDGTSTCKVIESKMKVKILSRNPMNYIRESKQDLHRIERNFDPSLHPLEAGREYVRALNATKLERVFAKPFIGCFDGHQDSVTAILPSPNRLSLLYTAAADGEIRAWRATTRQCVRIRRHGQQGDSCVRGICFSRDAESLLSVGADGVINRWDVKKDDFIVDDENEEEDETPVETIMTKSMLYGVSHHAKDNVFATCGNNCSIWEESRSAPVKSFTWGVDSTHTVSFNQVETSLLAACASDRSIILYDTRESVPLRRVVMKLKCNNLAWNPMEPSIFTVANEDYNLYTFDMRNLQQPLNVHKDFTAAVMDVAYSPTGQEFVAGSQDKTIRVFPVARGHSREIYHTKRMQRVTSVAWSKDARFLFSGSDEMNVRMWKARAAEQMGARRPRQEAAADYAEALREKFAAHPEIKRIARHRQVPNHVKNARKELRDSVTSKKRKEANLRANSKKGTVPHVSERRKPVYEEVGCLVMGKRQRAAKRRYHSVDIDNFDESSEPLVKRVCPEVKIFVAEPMRDKPVTDISGIGDTLGRKLALNGFDKAYVLLGQYLVLKKNRHLFVKWLRDEFNAPVNCAVDCYTCLAEWCNAYL